MSAKQVNAAIRHLGLEVVSLPRHRYCYFLSLETGDQVGQPLYGVALKDHSSAEWVKEAEWALANPEQY